jgi:hypothetical protein
MIRKMGRPITGARPQVSKRKPFVPDAKDTSADAQTFIRQAPAPFTNRMTAAQMPAPTSRSSKADSQNFHKDHLRYGGRGQTNSVKDRHTVPYGDVGYSSGPYQSKRGLNSINNGSPQTAKQIVGDGNFPKSQRASTVARGRASMAKLGLGKAYDDYRKFGGG